MFKISLIWEVSIIESRAVIERLVLKKLKVKKSFSPPLMSGLTRDAPDSSWIWLVFYSWMQHKHCTSRRMAATWSWYRHGHGTSTGMALVKI